MLLGDLGFRTDLAERGLQFAVDVQFIDPALKTADMATVTALRGKIRF